MKCDLCDDPVSRCPGYGTWCLCGYYVIACHECTRVLGARVRASARVAHEARHVKAAA